MSHESKDFVGLIWFFDDRERPGSLSPALGCRIEMPGDQDDGDPRLFRASVREDPARSSPHVNIEDQTVAFVDAVGGEEFPARAKYAPRSLRIRVEAEANPACSRHHRR